MTTTKQRPPAPMHSAVLDTSIDLIDVERRFDHGITWMRPGAGLLECRSHAIAGDDGRVWVIDPLDGEELDAELARLGDVAGVVVLLDRHLRGARQVAARHDVPLYVPNGRWRPGHAKPEGAIEYGAAGIDGAPFRVLEVVDQSWRWIERAIWWPERGLLVVADAVGGPRYYRSHLDEPLAVHPLLRVGVGTLPTALRGLDPMPTTLLLGHGPSLHGGAGDQLELALDEARRELPLFLLAWPRHVVRWARAGLGMGPGAAGC